MDSEEVIVNSETFLLNSYNNDKEHIINEPNPINDVLRTTNYVMRCAESSSNSNVQINYLRLKEEISQNCDRYIVKPENLPSWEHDYHYYDGTSLTVMYILVMDAINFCFWPLDYYEYDHLAKGLKRAIEKDNDHFSAEFLSNITPLTLSEWLQPYDSKEFVLKDDETVEIPLIDERARLIREVGNVLIRDFDGDVTNLIKKADGKSVRLVELITAHFPGFRDHSLYNGRQIFFYKRAQIFVADVWCAFKGKSLGAFDDINCLTCFADYRLPQLLRDLDILIYSKKLSSMIDRKEIIPSGSNLEVEIRAATVQIVELMQQEIVKFTKGNSILSIQLDNILWERGEALKQSLKPHHRTLSIFY